MWVKLLPVSDSFLLILRKSRKALLVWGYWWPAVPAACLLQAPVWSPNQFIFSLGPRADGSSALEISEPSATWPSCVLPSSPHVGHLRTVCTKWSPGLPSTHLPSTHSPLPGWPLPGHLPVLGPVSHSSLYVRRWPRQHCLLQHLAETLVRQREKGHC